MPATQENNPIGYQDGWLGVPRRVGPREYKYPFKHLGDVDTFILTETWKAAAGVYRPKTPGTPHPLWHTAYLVRETEPVPTGLGAEKWQRVYAKIPPDQVDYGFIDFNRPVCDGVNYASSAWGATFDGGNTWFAFTTRNTVVSSAALQAATQLIAEPMLHALFRVVDNGGHSCTFYGDDTLGNIQAIMSAALTSLSSINVTSSGTGNLHITYGGTISVLTIPLNVAYTFTAGTIDCNCQGSVTTPALTYFNLGSAHGAAAGNYAAYWCGDRLVGAGIIYAIPNSTTLAMLASDVAANSTITHCQVSPAGVRYAAGVKKCATRVTQKFYWPGITVGCATGADIPKPAVTTRDPVNYLAQIITAATWAVDGATDLEPYPDDPSPIKRVIVTELQMADAKDTAATGG